MHLKLNSIEGQNTPHWKAKSRGKSLPANISHPPDKVTFLLRVQRKWPFVNPTSSAFSHPCEELAEAVCSAK